MRDVFTKAKYVDHGDPSAVGFHDLNAKEENGEFLTDPDLGLTEEHSLFSKKRSGKVNNSSLCVPLQRCLLRCEDTWGAFASEPRRSRLT